MKCPKCGYVSFDYLEACKKCGKDLTEVKALLGIRTIVKGVPAEMAPAPEAAPEEAIGAETGMPEAGMEEAPPAAAGIEEEEFSLEDISFGEAEVTPERLEPEGGEPGVPEGEEEETFDLGDISFGEPEAPSEEGEPERVEEEAEGGEAETFGFEGIPLGEPEEPPVEAEPEVAEQVISEEEIAEAEDIDFGDISPGEGEEDIDIPSFDEDIEDISFETELGPAVGGLEEEEGEGAEEEDIKAEDVFEDAGSDEPEEESTTEKKTAEEAGFDEKVTEEVRNPQIPARESPPLDEQYTPPEETEDDPNFDESFSENFAAGSEEVFSEVGEDVGPANLSPESDSVDEWAFEELPEEESPDPEESDDISASASGAQIPIPFQEEKIVEEGEERVEVIPDIREVRKGGFFRRSLAFGIDITLQCLILYVFLFAGLYALKKGASLTGGGISVEQILNLAVPLFLLIFIVSAGYFTFFHWATGQTPGKMLFRLRVTSKDGGPVGLGKAFIRWFCYIISAIPLMSGYLMILIDRQKQGLHDKIAGTYVVDTRYLACEIGHEEEIIDTDAGDELIHGQTVHSGT